MDIITIPKHKVIEETALALATTWYEIGRSQGMTSKWKNARTYARANVEKFIPRAVQHLIDILGNPSFSESAKQLIYDALMERHNDPTLNKYMPNIDINKVIKNLEMIEKKKVIEIKTEPKTVLHKDKING